jgi:FLVCR family MFS transporter 7
VVELVIVPYGFNSVRFTQTDAGILGGVMTISGLLGCLLTSPIVGRTRKYKFASLLINIFAAAGTFLFAFTLYVGNIFLSCFCVAIIGFGMMPISAFMIELACEVTYPVGEAMSTGLLNMGGQVVGIVGTFIVDALLFSPLLANLVMAVFMGLAAIVTIFIKEDLKRFASDKVVGEVIVYNAPDTFLETPPESPLLNKAYNVERQTNEVYINNLTV